MVVCFSRHHQETLSTYKSITLLALFTIELPGIITCFWPLFWGGGVPSNHLPGHGSEKGYKPKQKNASGAIFNCNGFFPTLYSIFLAGFDA